MKTSHDLIVLGAGAGGLAAAFCAASHGARVALVYPASLGRSCGHRGCVPKKARYAARPALTPVAVAAGRHLADRLFGNKPDAKMDYENIPSVVFAEPPMGMAGLTEDAAREKHGDSLKIPRLTRAKPSHRSLSRPQFHRHQLCADAMGIDWKAGKKSDEAGLCR